MIAKWYDDIEYSWWQNSTSCCAEEVHSTDVNCLFPHIL